MNYEIYYAFNRDIFSNRKEVDFGKKFFRTKGVRVIWFYPINKKIENTPVQSNFKQKIMDTAAEIKN